MTIEELKKLFPNARMDYLDAFINAQSDLGQAGILENDLRLHHFLAQGAAETGGFTIYKESGLYSAKGLLKTFPKYFKSRSMAKAYAKRPKAIFNKTYGGRLGNNSVGDGYKYRGRGIFQITGKDAYSEYGKQVGLDLVANPDLASIPSNSIKLAIAYWSKLNLNEWADKDDILAVSRGINGGSPTRNIQPIGFADRKSWYAKIHRMFSDQPKAIESGLLQEGDIGPEVTKLQTMLRAHGYASGDIDGIYGANVKRAVDTFQVEHKLEGTPGKWRPDYWSILEASQPIQEERKDVTASDLHKAGDPAVVSLTWAQRVLMFLGFGGAITGGASEGASNFPALVTQYQPVLETIRPLFQWLATNGWILVIIGAIAAWFLAKWAIEHIVRSYKYFDYQGPYKEAE